jgi:hypothetical protein
MLRKKRQWEHLADEDPSSGLLNLFDVWIAFAAVLLLATMTYYARPGQPAAAADRHEQVDQSVKMESYRPTNEKLSGNGERLGVAYRLANGEVVYVPDTSAPAK